jgi:hypothetical protein
MNPEKFALVVGTAVLVAGSLGLVLHRIVPEKFLIGGSKDMIRSRRFCSHCCPLSSLASSSGLLMACMQAKIPRSRL